jgi:hypothetical protein
MQIAPTNSRQPKTTRHLQLRETVLLAFCDPVPTDLAVLQNISRREWRYIVLWLDTSGLALYFFDRVQELRLTHTIPASILDRLARNLRDNTERTDRFISESSAIQECFQDANLSYATLKGLSLWPLSVPKLELRSQLDIDFLIADTDAPEAKAILERMGYRLSAISGATWEFKAEDARTISVDDLYAPGAGRSVELHLETSTPGSSLPLDRVEQHRFRGMWMPFLPPVDMFLRQALNLHKRLLGEFVRAAHILEFRRHVLVRQGDTDFWMRLESAVAHDQETSLRIGVVVVLITSVMGEFAPPALTTWTADEVPLEARNWIIRYGRRIALMSFPGSKLYLILQRELAGSGVSGQRLLRQALLPHRLPSVIADKRTGELFHQSIARNLRQSKFILFRLRFHIFEGFRFLVESVRWQRYRNGLAR